MPFAAAGPESLANKDRRPGSIASPAIFTSIRSRRCRAPLSPMGTAIMPARATSGCSPLRRPSPSCACAMASWPAARCSRSIMANPSRSGDVALRMMPAGHVLGSAQIVLDYRGMRVVVSGDYKRRPDPTCASFEPVQLRPLHHRSDVRLAGFPPPVPTGRRSTSCCIRCRSSRTVATSSGSMRSANASGSWRCCGAPGMRSPSICTALCSN